MPWVKLYTILILVTERRLFQRYTQLANQLPMTCSGKGKREGCVGAGVGERAAREPQGKRWGNVFSSWRRLVWSCMPCLHAWEEATSDPEVWSEFLSPPSSPRPLIQRLFMMLTRICGTATQSVTAHSFKKKM